MILSVLPVPEKRQTLLFSATMSKEDVMVQGAWLGQRDPVFCQVKSDDTALVEVSTNARVNTHSTQIEFSHLKWENNLPSTYW